MEVCKRGVHEVRQAMLREAGEGGVAPPYGTRVADG